MDDETKKNVGRKPGVEIKQPQFDELMTALGMTRQKVAELLNKKGEKLTPQAISSWRTQESIPIAHLNRLASELIGQLKTREATELDKRSLKYLQVNQVIADASGSASPSSISDLLFSHDQTLNNQKIRNTTLDTTAERLSYCSLEELTDAIEAKGYEVFLRKVKKMRKL